MTRRETRTVRNAVLLTVAIAIIVMLVVTSYSAHISARISQRTTLNRIAASCTDDEISGFIIDGYIFFCRPQYHGIPDKKVTSNGR